MTSYRRYLMAGSSFFLTINLAERRPWLLTEQVDELRAAFRETCQRNAGHGYRFAPPIGLFQRQE
jgi:REP element-mobilizing transposase RayT